MSSTASSAFSWVSSVAASMTASDQTRNWSRSFAGTPRSSAMTSSGSGAAIVSTRSTSAVGSTASRTSRARRRTCSSNAATRRAVNPVLTSLRYLLCTGGSTYRIESAAATVRSRSAISTPWLEQNVAGSLLTARTSAWRVKAQNFPGSYQCTGDSARSRARSASASPAQKAGSSSAGDHLTRPPPHPPPISGAGSAGSYRCPLVGGRGLDAWGLEIRGGRRCRRPHRPLTAPEHRSDRSGRYPHEQRRAADLRRVEDDGDDRQPGDLTVVGEQCNGMRMVAEAGDRHVCIAAREPRQQPDEQHGRERETELATEWESEPETRTSVVEHRPQEPAVTQPRDRVEDPHRPDHQDDTEQVFVPPGAGTRPPRTAGHQAPGGEGEVAHERVAQRHHQRHVADEDLLATQRRVEHVMRVGEPEMHGPVLEQRTERDRRQRIAERPPPAQVTHRAPGEDEAEQCDVPALDERAVDLTHGSLRSVDDHS